MKISKIKMLSWAGKEIRDNCEKYKYKGCFGCMFQEAYHVCPFVTNVLPRDWNFEDDNERRPELLRRKNDDRI